MTIVISTLSIKSSPQQKRKKKEISNEISKSKKNKNPIVPNKIPNEIQYKDELLMNLLLFF